VRAAAHADVTPRGGRLTRANPNSGEEMATPTLMLPQPFRKTACFPE
jgi:hypothetical protein